MGKLGLKIAGRCLRDAGIVGYVNIQAQGSFAAIGILGCGNYRACKNHTNDYVL